MCKNLLDTVLKIKYYNIVARRCTMIRYIWTLYIIHFKTGIKIIILLEWRRQCNIYPFDILVKVTPGHQASALYTWTSVVRNNSLPYINIKSTTCLRSNRSINTKSKTTANANPSKVYIHWNRKETTYPTNYLP